MPFIKGRQKTGGRSKNSSGRKSDKLIDQLKAHGFNYVKELAHALHDLPLGSGPVGTKYTELKSLLPFMAPKLREKDVEFTAPTEAQQAANRPISDEDLLKAMEHGKPKQSRATPSLRSDVLPPTSGTEISSAETLADSKLG